MMSVAIIAPLPPPVTGQSVTTAHVRDIAERAGFKVSVVDTSSRSLESGAVRVRALTAHAVRLGRAIWAARRADIIYFTPSRSRVGAVRDALFYIAIGSAIQRTILHVHGWGLRNVIGVPFIGRIVKARMRQSAACVVLAQSMRQDLESALPPFVQEIPCSVEDEMFVDPSRVDAKFAANGYLRVLFCSNMIESKGYLDVLAACERLASERSDLRVSVRFAGAFASESACSSFTDKIAHARVDARYCGVVQRHEKAQMFADAHVFCLPTYYAYEGLPITILEAYAAGCVVLTTLHASIGDVFRPEVNGIEVAPRDVSSITLALNIVERDRAAATAIGRHNLSYVSGIARFARFEEAVLGVLSYVERM
jgi:glycosyltransferase involved in cell wall biosynthesis